LVFLKVIFKKCCFVIFKRIRRKITKNFHHEVFKKKKAAYSFKNGTSLFEKISFKNFLKTD